MKSLANFLPNVKKGVKTQGPAASAARKGPRQPSRAGGSFDFIQLIHDWPAIVGDKLAAQTSPLKLIRGQLIVLTQHSSYAHVLDAWSEDLKKKIGERFPELRRHLKKLSFQVGVLPSPQERPAASCPPTAAAQRFRPEILRQKEQARKKFADIEDPEILELFVSLQIQLEQDSHR